MPVSPEGRARSNAQLKTIRSAEQARAVRAIGTAKRRERAAVLGRRVSDDAWEEQYVQQAFSERWSVYYRQTKRRLMQQYAVAHEEREQYRLLIEQVASISTLLAHAVANHRHDMTTAEWRSELRAYIAQLQRYTEAEKRIEVQITSAQTAQFEGFCAIVDHLVNDGELRRALFGAFRRFGRTNDAAAVLAALASQGAPAPPLLNGVIDHVPGETHRS